MTPRVAGRPTAPVAESWARIERWLERHMPAVRATLAPGATARTLAKFEEAIGQPLPADVRESWRIHDGQRSAWGVPGAEILHCQALLFGYALLPLLEPRGVVAVAEGTAFSEWETYMGRPRGSPFGPGPNRAVRASGPRRPAPQEPAYSSELDRWSTSTPPGAIRPVYFRPGWIPLATAGEYPYIGVDLDPGPAGVAGQVINFGKGSDDKYALARSWGQFLEDFADELQSGNAAADPGRAWEELTLRDPPGHFTKTHFAAWSAAKIGRGGDPPSPTGRPGRRRPA